MFEMKPEGKMRKFILLILESIILTAALQSTAQAVNTEALEGIWDPAKYISLDEVKPGMDAYCLTEYGIAGIEKFGLKVIDVVRGLDPGTDVILVEGTDERFLHTGPVAGCSGSPVYIQGRLAGALAYAWTFSKDPLYAVQPIEEMLKVGLDSKADSSQQTTTGGMFSAYDFTRPINFAQIDKQFKNELTKISHNMTGMTPLPCPLVTSGLPTEVCEQLDELVKPMGMMVVAGGSNSSASAEKPRLVPGACLAVPLVTGDITMAAVGTATEVIDDKVYGFGHNFLGYGSIDLPMATGKVHTIVSNVNRSFKLASVEETVGALTYDQSKAIFGRIGAKAKMIPLTIRIDRYNDIEKHLYNCQLADNRLRTPLVLRSVIAGAALQLGDFPPDHTVEYKVAIGLENGDSVNFKNVSTALGINELIAESIGSVMLLMNNPFKEVNITSLDFDIRIAPKSLVSHIWSVNLSDSEVKPGESIEIEVVIESVMAGKKKYLQNLEIPEDLAPGTYQLMVCGAQNYENFLTKAVAHRFVAQSYPDLIEALNYVLSVVRDKLYFLLVLPPGGVAIDKAELPDLPGTKALVLQSSKRAIKIRPYQHWIERSLKIGTVVSDQEVLKITVKN